MVKLADTLDLGSSARACRFKSCHPYQLKDGFQAVFSFVRRRTCDNAYIVGKLCLQPALVQLTLRYYARFSRYKSCHPYQLKDGFQAVFSFVRRRTCDNAYIVGKLCLQPALVQLTASKGSGKRNAFANTVRSGHSRQIKHDSVAHTVCKVRQHHLSCVDAIDTLCSNRYYARFSRYKSCNECDAIGIAFLFTL